jgi:hypothetical protein
MYCVLKKKKEKDCDFAVRKSECKAMRFAYMMIYKQTTN